MLINYTLNIQIKQHSPKLNVVTPYGVINKPFSVWDNIFIMENQEEVWKDIVGYEGHYKVSNCGNVMSFKHKPNGKLSKFNTYSHYFMVSISLSGKEKLKTVHRLVAEAFIPNPLNKPCVNHIDGNKLNNNLSNLEWCTYRENELHSYAVLGKKPNKTGLGKTREKSPSAKKIYQFSLEGVFIRKFDSCGLAIDFLKQNGYPRATQGHLCAAANGLYHISYDSKWSYSPNFLDAKKYNTASRKSTS